MNHDTRVKDKNKGVWNERKLNLQSFDGSHFRKRSTQSRVRSFQSEFFFDMSNCFKPGWQSSGYPPFFNFFSLAYLATSFCAFRRPNTQKHWMEVKSRVSWLSLTRNSYKKEDLQVQNVNHIIFLYVVILYDTYIL